MADNRIVARHGILIVLSLITVILLSTPSSATDDIVKSDHRVEV